MLKADEELKYFILAPTWVYPKTLGEDGYMVGSLRDKRHNMGPEPDMDFYWLIRKISESLEVKIPDKIKAFDRAKNIVSKHYSITACAYDYEKAVYKFAGVISWQPCRIEGNRTNYIRTIFIAPEYRKNGIGKRLLSLLFDTLKHDQWIEQKKYQDLFKGNHGKHDIKYASRAVRYLVKYDRDNELVKDVFKSMGFDRLKYIPELSRDTADADFLCKEDNRDSEELHNMYHGIREPEDSGEGDEDEDEDLEDGLIRLLSEDE